MVGGGSAGCVLAARLSEDRAHRVLLVESGPDHGPRASGTWPPALLDPADWTAAASWRRRDADTGQMLDCGKTIGGSSAINAGGFNWPHRADLAAWPASWHLDAMRPWLRAVEADPDGPEGHGRSGPVPVARPVAPLCDFFAAFAEASGTGFVADINDPDCPPGLARRARNVARGERWNAAFAYLDPCRERANLRILPDVSVSRLRLPAGRAAGAELADGRAVQAGRVVLAAGAYGTPHLLLRSGIGPAEHLRAAGIRVAADHPDVGANLRDHPVGVLAWTLRAAAGRIAGTPWQVVLRARSPLAQDDGFDLQIAPRGPVMVGGAWQVDIRVEPMKPRSTGSVRLDTANPDGPPVIRSMLLDAAHDRRVMAHGTNLARRIARHPAFQGALLDELPARVSAATVTSYHHPCGTCRMGRVVDEAGRVGGLAGLVIGDASILPAIPRVPLNLLVLAAAERIAAGLN